MKHETCGLLIKQIHDTVRKHLDNSLREKELTLAQVRVLMELGEGEGYTKSLKELERRFNFAQSTIVGIVCRLEAKGFVQGFAAPGDNRVKLVKLTPEGEKFREASIREVEEMEERLISCLTEAEQQDFLRMLRAVHGNIKSRI